MSNIVFPSVARFAAFITSIAGRSCPLPQVDGPVELLAAWDVDGNLIAGSELPDSVGIEASRGTDLASGFDDGGEGDDTYSNWSPATRNGYILLDPLRPHDRYLCAVYKTSAFTAEQLAVFYKVLTSRIERFAVEVPAETRSTDDSRYYAELVSLAHRCMPGKLLVAELYELVVLHTLVADECPQLREVLDSMLA